MNIGIVPNLNASTGGVYQYSLNMIKAISRLIDEGSKDKFIIFSDQNDNSDLKQFMRKNLTISQLNSTGTARKIGKLILNKAFGEETSFKIWEITKKMGQSPVAVYNGKIKKKEKLREEILKLQIDLMIYPTSNALSFEIGIPYIFVIHDLQHRLQPEFPEVNADGQDQEREYIFQNGIKYANIVIVDSEVGKEDVLRLYKHTGISKDRIEILPFTPAYYLKSLSSKIRNQQIKFKYKMPSKYIFYPAQFWPHKNHKRIIQALALLHKKYNINIYVVFTGSAMTKLQKETLHECLAEAKKHNLSHLVQNPGYISNEEISYFYAHAQALVMPTFFGPTNIPVLEAWQYGCPVITSDIRGIREQVGTAGLLVDPRSVTDIASAIYAIWTNDKLRKQLCERGKVRLARYTFEDYYKKLKYIIMKAKSSIHRYENN